MAHPDQELQLDRSAEPPQVVKNELVQCFANATNGKLDIIPDLLLVFSVCDLS